MNNQNRKRIYINGRYLTQHMTGVQRYSHELLAAFDTLLSEGQIPEKEYEFILLCPPGELLHAPAFQYIRFRQVGHLHGHAWEQWDLPGHCTDGILFCPGNTAPIRSLRSSRPVIVTVHSLSFHYFPEAYSRLFRLWYRILMPAIFSRASRVITVSRSEKKAILDLYPAAEEKLTVVQNGGLPQKYLGRELPAAVRDKPFLLYVGSLSKGKNLRGVLAAFELLAQKSDLALVIAGAAARTFSRSDLNISDEISRRLIFKGQIDNPDELIGLYRSALCLLFPSFYEASPLPPIEAMACGCPVIASAIPSLQERCGDAALYCNPGDPADIAARVSDLLDDSGLRGRLAARGKIRAAEFDWRNCASKTFGVIREVTTQV